MINVYDVVIIGSGFSGISTAYYLAKKDNIKKILIFDAGNNYLDRNCQVKKTGVCINCSTCNLIAGFGGCFRFGDEAKISLYPSGQRLLDYVDSVEELENINTFLIHDIFKNIKFQPTQDMFNNVKLKKYPVSILQINTGKVILKKLFRAIKKNSKIELKLNTTINTMNIVNDKIVSVEVDTGLTYYCNNIVVAVGRYGRDWFKKEMCRLGIDFKVPKTSVGVRFEVEKTLLINPGLAHPDLKTKIKYQTGTVKTFCFCGGIGGGIIKAPLYNNIAYLDGHIISNPTNKFGNFALLYSVSEEELNQTIELYKQLLNGKPVIQNYLDFKNKQVKTNRIYDSTLTYATAGNLANIFSFNAHECLCKSFEYLFNEFSVSKETIALNDINVLGLEVENNWNEVKLDKNLQTSIPRIYVVGDAAGISQGIFQATFLGYLVADAISTKKK